MSEPDDFLSRATPLDDPIQTRLCPTCEQPTAKFSRITKKLICLNQGCSACGKTVTEDAILAAFQGDLDKFRDDYPLLRPGSAEQRIEAMTEYLLGHDVRPRMVLELVLSWAQTYTGATPDGIVSAIEQVAERTATA